jgi:very-short-patch-repair endonuclease
VRENTIRMQKENIGTSRPCKEGTKDKIRKTLLKTYKERPEILENRKVSGINQFSGKYSSIEKLIADVLKSKRIFFYHNLKIGKYFADFVIFHNVIIECDGEYWHRDKEKDLKRDAYMMDRGYYVFRLSGKRIIKNPTECVDTIVNIIQFIGNHKDVA